MSIVSHSMPFGRIAVLAVLGVVALAACSETIPYRPHADAVPARAPDPRYKTLNQDGSLPVVYVKLDEDILRPAAKSTMSELPKTIVGPFELREETLASALQLVMGKNKIPMAFQTAQATTRTVTMTGLKGPLDQVVDKLCSLADLYCSYENDTLVIKDTESFSVSLPPFIADNYDPFVNGLKAITGGETYVDGLTHTLTYTTTHRNHMKAMAYFDRLRANTAMIVYEMQIWEVALNDNNRLGINWNEFTINGGRFDYGINNAAKTAITGGLGLGTQFTGSGVTADVVLNFLQTQGAVKTISQPQITVLSGSSAKLRVGNSRDYVSQITRTVGLSALQNDNVSVTTSKLDTGLDLEINSAWDSSTVYGSLKVNLQNLIQLRDLTVGTTQIQLPETSDRAIETKLRVRPGDAVIIGGIVEERDELSQEGPPGQRTKPLFLTNRTRAANNSELVFMLRPRVVVYTDRLPEQARLMSGGQVAEPARADAVPNVLTRVEALPPVAAANVLMPVPLPVAPVEDILVPTPLVQPALADYLKNLPADDIAPAP